MRPWKMTSRLLRKGSGPPSKQCTVNTAYSEKGVQLTSTKDVGDRWREILQSVSSIPPVRKQGLGMGSLIPGAEVAQGS